MLLLVYIIMILYLIYLVWITEPLFLKNESYKHYHQPFVSIIISAKNESNNIEKLLHGLANQNYPKEKYEIIVVNDKSTDDTRNILLKYEEEIENLSILNIKETPNNWASKKWALNKGIEYASGDIILQTDADCRHHKNWVLKMMQPFSESNIGFVAGPSYIGRYSNFWNQILKLESIAQESFSYANSKRKLYLSCTARNIAFKKTVFYEVNGYEDISHIESGDDDLLLHKTVTQTSWKIKYISNFESVVSSEAPQSIKSFYLQRLRYASKGLLYYQIPTPNEVKIILPFLLISNFMCIVSIVMFINNQEWAWLFPIIIKSISDIILISKYMEKIRMKFKILNFIILTIIHPFYVVILGTLAPFIRVAWK